MNGGTRRGRARRMGFTAPAAGKTGTDHDAWFAGYTSSLLCIVWVGNDDYTDIKIAGRACRRAHLGRVHEKSYPVAAILRHQRIHAARMASRSSLSTRTPTCWPTAPVPTITQPLFSTAPRPPKPATTKARAVTTTATSCKRSSASASRGTSAGSRVFPPRVADAAWPRRRGSRELLAPSPATALCPERPPRESMHPLQVCSNRAHSRAG